MPTAQRVVDRITATDAVTGNVLRTELRYHRKPPANPIRRRAWSG